LVEAVEGVWIWEAAVVAAESSITLVTKYPLDK
jgi:hypothetical protein